MWYLLAEQQADRELEDRYVPEFSGSCSQSDCDFIIGHNPNMRGVSADQIVRVAQTPTTVLIPSSD